LVTEPAPTFEVWDRGDTEAMLQVAGYWDDFRIEVLRTVDLGDHVVVTTDRSGRSKDTGIEVTTQFAFPFTLGDGKLVNQALIRSSGP
jgi:hypothetical protein